MGPVVRWALAVLFLWAAPAACASQVVAGVAREEFALPAKVPLAGYSRRHGKPSLSVHDPVGVRALVLQDDETVAVLVSCDLLIVDEHLFGAVRRRLLASGLPPRHTLLLAGTHTHSGPGAYGTRFFEKISMGHFDPRVFDALVEAIVRAVAQARSSAAPARIAFAASRTHGLVKNRMEDDGPVDDELTVVGLSRPDAAAPFAVLVGFAAHPTTLGASNMERSGDYPGVLMREVERRLPGSTCVFFAGAAGDQAPVKSGPGFASAESIGTALAQRAVELLGQRPPESLGPLHAVQETMALPPARLTVHGWRIPRWLGARFVDDDATLSVVRAGPVVFFGVPCDVVASLGARLKEAARARGVQPVVVGFASDYIGYCVSVALYRQTQTYETAMAFNGPDAGERVIERLTQLFQQLPGQ